MIDTAPPGPPSAPFQVGAASGRPPIRFGDAGRFELNPREQCLFVDGRPAALGSRAFDLLMTLSAEPGHLRGKSTLLDRVWPNLVVEESNLHTQISALRKVLGGDVIATVPARGYRFAAAVLPAGVAPATAPGTAAPAPASVPLSAGAAAAAAAGRPATPRLVGRRGDLDLLATALQSPGCVSLVGPAGVGKTALAHAAVARWSARSAWVDLAALTDGALIADALARALALRLAGGDALPQLTQLLQGPAGERLLLVLDNAEHLVEAVAAVVVPLLHGAPGLHLLVTSQLPLAVTAERVQRLSPLALTGEAAGAGGGDGPGDGPGDGLGGGLGNDLDQRPGGDASDGGALALLVARITAADHRRVPGPEAGPLLRAICHRLDGLPLALEMAAARVPLLGLQGVHDALLAERLSLLTAGPRDAGARHRTLRAALAWSHRLLAPDEQRLFRRLSVFTDGFTLDLLAAMAGPDADTRWALIDRLAVLVDRSLVTTDQADPPRYRLLETMRAFASEQLTVAGDGDDARRCHALAVLALFEHGDTGKPGADREACLRELANVREAVLRAQRHDLAVALRLTVQTTRVSTFSLWRNDALRWLAALEPALRAPAAEAVPLELRSVVERVRARPGAADEHRRAGRRPRRLRDLAALQRPLELQSALGALVRACGAAGSELDAAVSELQAVIDAHPDLPLRARMTAQGALCVAAGIRGDYAALLRTRLVELEMAREARLTDMVDAVESNVIIALNHLGRHREAAERSRALLARLRYKPDSGNLPWAWRGLIAALLGAGDLAGAASHAAAGMAACLHFDVPGILVHMLARLAALQQRPSPLHCWRATPERAMPAGESSSTWKSKRPWRMCWRRQRWRSVRTRPSGSRIRVAA